MIFFLPNRDDLVDFFPPNAQLYQSLLTFSEVLIQHLLWVCDGWLVGSRHFFPVGDFTGLNFLFSHCFWQAGQQCRTLLPLRLNVELTLCLTETDWTHQRAFSLSTLEWLFARVIIGPIGSHVLLPTGSTGHEDIWLASFVYKRVERSNSLTEPCS